MAECTDHNLSSNRLPTGNDDNCNTSGEGVFEIGAYWGYDPTAAGADTAANGDCYRLFQRTGDNCTVAEWLEIATTEMTTDAAAPTATDCCPAGSLWYRPDALSGIGADELYISFADMSVNPPVCRWCRLCGCDDIQSVNQQINVASILINIPAPGGLPAVFTEYGNQADITVTNPSTCAQMSLFRTLAPSFITFIDLCGVAPAVVEATIEWSNDGGGTWNPTEISLVTVNPGETVTIPLPGLDASILQAVGGSNQLTIRSRFRNVDGNFCGQFTTGDKVITVEGVNFQ